MILANRANPTALGSTFFGYPYFVVDITSVRLKRE